MRISSLIKTSCIVLLLLGMHSPAWHARAEDYETTLSKAMKEIDRLENDPGYLRLKAKKQDEFRGYFEKFIRESEEVANDFFVDGTKSISLINEAVSEINRSISNEIKLVDPKSIRDEGILKDVYAKINRDAGETYKNRTSAICARIKQLKDSYAAKLANYKRKAVIGMNSATDAGWIEKIEKQYRAVSILLLQLEQKLLKAVDIEKELRRPDIGFIK